MVFAKKFNLKFSYLFWILFSFVFIILFGGFNYKLISSWFNGNSAVLSPPYKVTYYSNFPNSSDDENSFYIISSFSEHVIMDFQYDIPVGLNFICWHSVVDGYGVSYHIGDKIKVTGDVSLYAEWEITSEYAPNNSLDVEEENNTSNNDNISDNEESDNNHNDSNDNLGSSDVVNGSSSSGNFSDGSGIGSSSNDSSFDSGDSSASDKNSSSGGNSSSSNDNPSLNSNSNDKLSEDKLENDIVDLEFIFYDGIMEFAKTSCKITNGNSCMLVLPDISPSIVGYSFVGWGENSTCDGKIIKSPIIVDSDKIYYACYNMLKSTNKEEEISFIYIIISIWIIAGVLVYFVIKKFKNLKLNVEG